jgi:hypothetical protein
MLAQAEDIPPFVQHILDYYRLPYININVKDMGNSIACQGFSTMHISQKIINEKPIDVIKTVFAHEISHRTLLPGTVVEQELHMVIAQNEGIDPAHVPEFLNIIYDLVIDRINLLDRDWCDTYIIGTEDLRPWKFQNNELSPFTVFNNLVVAMVNDYYHRDYALGKTEQEIFDLLYNDNRPFEKRLTDLARIFKQWYSQTDPISSPRGKHEKCSADNTDPDDDNNESHEPKTNSSLPLDRKLTREDIKKIAEKLAEIYKDLGSTINVNKEIIVEFKKRRAKKMALPMIIAGSSNTSSWDKCPAGQWKPGHSAHELDLNRTITTNGIFLPEITTQRIAETESSRNPTTNKKPHVVILADISVSMNSYNAVERMIDATIAINLIAKRNGWPVTLISFHDNHKVLASKSRDYAKTEDLAARLHTGGTGTYIYSAIHAAAEIKEPQVLFIITDDDNTKLTEYNAIHSLKKIKDNKSNIFLYFIGRPLNQSFLSTMKNVITKAFYIPRDQPYTDSIIANTLPLA